MAEKSGRRRMMEESLAADPHDTFLRYGLAMLCLREGDLTEGRERLRALIADHPTDQVAAHQQLAQSYLESEQCEEAQRVLEAGIALALKVGDQHAAMEMQGLLETMADRG
jgi:predicted Zn-dependent protease